MARKGSSFDFQLSVPIGQACKPDAEHRERVMKAGIDAQACADMENWRLPAPAGPCCDQHRLSTTFHDISSHVIGINLETVLLDLFRD
jgi:hypothetical protein